MRKIVAALGLSAYCIAGVSALQLQEPGMVNMQFTRMHNGHTYTVTTHRRLMQPPGGGMPGEDGGMPGGEDGAAGGMPGGDEAAMGPAGATGGPQDGGMPGGEAGGVEAPMQAAAGNTTDAGMGGEPGAMGGPDGGTGGGPGGGMGGGPGDGGGSMGGGLPGGNVPGIAPANTEVEPAATQYGVTGETFAPSEYYVAYEIDDAETGAKVTVELTDTTREIFSNAVPSFETGEFPNNDGNPFTISEQNITLSLPLEPVYHGQAVFAHTAGITVSGFQMEPGTNERAYCDNDLVLTVESFQDLVALGIDFNNAHVQPHGEYHFHGVSAPAMAGMEYDPTQDLVHIGFAYDGYMIYYSQSGVYKSSWGLVDSRPESTNCVYNTPADALAPEQVQFPDNGEPDGTFLEDWQFNEGSGDLDKCNGLIVNGNYAYFLTDEFPYIPRCLNGDTGIDQAIGAFLPSSAGDMDNSGGMTAPPPGSMGGAPGEPGGMGEATGEPGDIAETPGAAVQPRDAAAGEAAGPESESTEVASAAPGLGQVMTPALVVVSLLLAWA